MDAGAYFFVHGLIFERRMLIFLFPALFWAHRSVIPVFGQLSRMRGRRDSCASGIYYLPTLVVNLNLAGPSAMSAASSELPAPLTMDTRAWNESFKKDWLVKLVLEMGSRRENFPDLGACPHQRLVLRGWCRLTIRKSQRNMRRRAPNFSSLRVRAQFYR